MLKEIKYIPKSLGEKFIGHVQIEAPLLRDRLRYVKECNFKLDQNGEVNISVDNIDVIAKMIEIAAKHVKKVEIESVESGYKYQNFEELEADTSTQQIVIEIASQVMNGFTLGEN